MIFAYVSTASLLNTFSVFGPLKVEWPGKESKHPRCPPQGTVNLVVHRNVVVFYVILYYFTFCVGYVYLVFDWEKSVKALLQACTPHRLHSDDYIEFYYKLSSRRIHSKDVR